MNERIRELQEQAFREADGKRIPVMDKFAELIIRECCDQVIHREAEYIKKHFGVEE